MKTFHQTWGAYKAEPYEQVISVQRFKGQRHKATPLEHRQNKARAEFHASITRAHNNALDKLESWAHKAYYGVPSVKEQHKLQTAAAPSVYRPLYTQARLYKSNS
jgi:hypothetical protein